jgi:transposase InsO family protein
LRRTRATAWQISAALGVPRSTVTRVLGRCGLNRVAACEPPAPVRRYEWPHAGDLVHVDVKRLGRIQGVGHRIHGDRRRRARRVGWEFLHVAIDDATRLAYVEVLAAQDATTCAAFWRRAVRWYGRCGLRIRRLLTDNGFAYRARVFAQACRPWAIRHRFTRPYHPQTNGKAERFIQTLLREWAYRTPYANSAHRTAALRPYVRFYNRQRPHASLGRRSPWMRFQEAA